MWKKNRGKHSAGILLLLQKCRQMKSAGPNEKQKGKTKEKQFSEREQNKNSLRGTRGLRSTV